MLKGKEILISGAYVYKKVNDKTLWFIVQQGDDDKWEMPKTTVRRGESSVRASIRLMGEQGGMRAKVLEEVGRAVGSTSVNGKLVAQRYIYYLMVQRGDSEVLGFVKYDWLEYKKAVARLSSKKEQKLFENAKEIAKEVAKNRKREEEEEEEVDLELQEPIR